MRWVEEAVDRGTFTRLDAEYQLVAKLFAASTNGLRILNIAATKELCWGY